MRNASHVGTRSRLGLAGIGLVAMASITVACSSSTSGNPGNGATAGTTIAPTTVAGQPTASLPSVSIPASLSASVPQLSGSKFCADAGKVAQIGSSLSGGNMSSLNKVVKSIDSLAAEAPSEVKGDLQTMSTELHKAMSGNVDQNMISKLTTAGQHIEQYLSTHCKSS